MRLYNKTEGGVEIPGGIVVLGLGALLIVGLEWVEWLPYIVAYFLIFLGILGTIGTIGKDKK